MEQVVRIGMDTSKHVFQLHGVYSADEPVLRRHSSRNFLLLRSGSRRAADRIIGRGSCDDSDVKQNPSLPNMSNRISSAARTMPPMLKRYARQ